ncbi:transcriptional regulator (plasmid) [Halorutilales archaeon Cl-col2-1]
MSMNKDRHEGIEIPEIPEGTDLIITSETWEEFKEGSVDRARSLDEGEQPPHVVNIEDPSEFRKLLTPKRLELIETVVEDPPESIRDLADKLDRGLREVHEDLELLEEYGIVKFEEEGRAKRPYIPYETVRISGEIAKKPPA